MKRSDYEAKSRRFWMDSVTPPMEAAWRPGRLEKYVANDVRAAEAAGVVWDLEEEPLPEKLEVAVGGGGCSFIAPRGGLWTGEAARRRSFDEAVRRYNAWPELEKLVERLEAWAAGKIWDVEERRYMEAAVRALREFLAGRKAC